jgi:hypothetical protein
MISMVIVTLYILYQHRFWNIPWLGDGQVWLLAFLDPIPIAKAFFFSSFSSLDVTSARNFLVKVHASVLGEINQFYDFCFKSSLSFEPPEMIIY